MTSQERRDDDPEYRSTADDVGGQCGDQTDGVHRPPPDTAHRTWTTGEQYGFGTACDHGSEAPSRVWFTLTEGALAEPRFPRVDLLQFRLVDVLVTDPGAITDQSGDGAGGDDPYVARTHNETRLDDHAETIDRTTEPVEREAPVYRQTITETGDRRAWQLQVEYVTDPDRETILFDCEFVARDGRDYDVFVVAEPAIGGYLDGTRVEALATDEGAVLTAFDDGDERPAIRDERGNAYDVTAALVADTAFDRAWVGRYEEDRSVPKLERDADSAAGGARSDGPPDRVMVGQIGDGEEAVAETLALGFATGETARDDEPGTTLRDAAAAAAKAAYEQASGSLERGFDAVRGDYVDGWKAYLSDRPVPDAVREDPDLEAQYLAALQSLKAVEDKTFRGASVASPSVPWGDNVDASTPRDYGYNFTWSRDLYQVFTALSAADDAESARTSVEYLYSYQQREDGFLPQNTYLDGRTRWDGEQLDNVAYPAVMAYQLDRRHGIGFEDVTYDYADVRRSVEYLLRSGPRTEQERWEEEDGYSPSTIAAVAAGLGCAAALADEQGERADALAYLAHADWWRVAVDEWCATETGTDGRERTPYYVRVTREGDPEAGHERSLANNGPTLDERAIVDAGFLELVRLGLRDPDEPVIRNSLSVVDETIRVDTPSGPAWYRYNGDGYGELGDRSSDPGAPWSMDRQGAGRLWPIFTGERGEYELLAGTDTGETAPERLLSTMEGFANSGRMLPEQVWDRPDPTDYGWTFGEGTGSATPLAWSMAQFVRLAIAIDAGEPVETPQFLRARYRNSAPPDAPSLTIEAVDWADEDVTVRGTTDGDDVVVWTPSGATRLDGIGGRFERSIRVEGDDLAVIAATDADDLRCVGTSIERFSRPR